MVPRMNALTPALWPIKRNSVEQRPNLHAGLSQVGTDL